MPSLLGFIRDQQISTLAATTFIEMGRGAARQTVQSNARRNGDCSGSTLGSAWLQMQALLAAHEREPRKGDPPIMIYAGHHHHWVYDAKIDDSVHVNGHAVPGENLQAKARLAVEP